MGEKIINQTRLLPRIVHLGTGGMINMINEKEYLEELGRRIIKSEYWQWLPGMADCWGGRVREGDGVDRISAYPDLNDAATLGCVLSLVRNAHRNPVYVEWDFNTGYWKIFFLDNLFESEAEALVTALEKAPPKSYWKCDWIPRPIYNSDNVIKKNDYKDDLQQKINQLNIEIENLKNNEYTVRAELDSAHAVIINLEKGIAAQDEVLTSRYNQLVEKYNKAKYMLSTIHDIIISNNKEKEHFHTSLISEYGCIISEINKINKEMP